MAVPAAAASRGAEILVAEQCCCCFNLKDGIVCLSTFVMLRSLIIAITSFIPPLQINSKNNKIGLTDNTTMMGLYGVNLLLCVISQGLIFKYYLKWRRDKYRVKYIQRLPRAHWIFFIYLAISFIIQTLVTFMQNKSKDTAIFIKPEWVTLILEFVFELYFLFKVNCYVAYTTKDLEKPEKVS